MNPRRSRLLPVPTPLAGVALLTPPASAQVFTQTKSFGPRVLNAITGLRANGDGADPPAELISSGELSNSTTTHHR
jgi:hypothetical protein